ncbi:hypothetical protein CK503_14515 [Aliifodinibius salipaludis]|uniref:DUF2914 domain-containing protein n=1 Tax=Fodinibius salipaludis TaxID=2032627 RepID=A0A2A2G7R9_9BACT|nr:DUF2914 domain-containing protein [Aliifodinibius salipaludis]PAU92895.1 hypothetical protein CK503_14515 [Aliifodinibius salipaludis]
MIKLHIFAFLFLLISLSVTVQAQNISVQQFDFATAIEDREPSGIDTVFTADVGTVYCFTQVKGISDTTKVTHEWYYKDEEKAQVDLTVAGDNWRTWSSKTIPESWIGPWRVMVLGPNGNVLETKNFVITEN